jgi:hypothetical protein
MAGGPNAIVDKMVGFGAFGIVVITIPASSASHDLDQRGRWR